MEKYILRKSFTKGVFKKKKGDIVEGTLSSNQNDTTTYLVVPFVLNGVVRRVSIPIGILKKYEGNSNDENRSSFEGSEENSEVNTSSKFTLKNIVIGVVGIVVVYAILKSTKIIK